MNNPENKDAVLLIGTGGSGTTASFLQTQPAPEAVKQIHPLNDPDVWLHFPTYTAPTEINAKRAQSEIDSIAGVTRDNKSIIKLVWSGDRSFWYQFYMKWDRSGKPLEGIVRRPLIRHKVLRDENKKFIRDVFPPRWLLLSRIEPEQFADSWARDSYVFAPEIGTIKQIRPDNPPEAMYLWYATIARHHDFCCAKAYKEQRMCYGEYAPPSHAHNELGEQKRALEKSGISSNPFEKVDGAEIRRIENENNGYLLELAQMEIESEIYLENPFALLGIEGSRRAQITAKQADQTVKDYLDRRKTELAKRA